MKRLEEIIKQDPMFFVMGLSIILLAIMGTSVRHVSSAMFGLLFLLSFFVAIFWKKEFSHLANVEKLFVLSFVMYTASGLLAYYNVDDVDEYIKLLERYFRFLMAVPIFLLMINKNKSLINYLYIGAALSGPVIFFIALTHYIQFPDQPAKGYYHHIIFGQLAIVNVGIMIVYLITNDLKRIVQFGILASIFCGLAAVILSQARGVWIVFPVYLIIAFAYLFKKRKLRVKVVLALLVLTTIIVSFTPIGSLIQQRSEKAVSEITAFYSEGDYTTSVGTRLAMWEIAFDVWQRYPIVGTGPGDFDDEVLIRKEAGEYIEMDLHNSTHNIYVQALVGTGMVGLLVLLLNIILMPLLLFFDKTNIDKTAGLVGAVVVMSFAIFGVSESWILRLPIVSVFIIYILVIASHVHIVNKESRLK